MKVILLDNIKGVGKKDDVINASDGYARNFLFPKKLAIEANTENMAKLQAKKNSEKFKKDTDKENAKQIAERLEQITLYIKVKAGDNGKIFGGVTAKEIADNLKNQYDVEIDKRKIELKDTIKNIGKINVNIKLYEGVIAELKIEIISE